MSDEPVNLAGLDGSNPLAFLAALGTLRSLTLAWPDRRVRMGWRDVGGWRPSLEVDPPAAPDAIVRALDARLKTMCDHPVWSLGPDLSVTPQQFRDRCAGPAAAAARSSGDRTWADFAASFGCEALATDSGTIQDTALRTMSGAGHQHFLEFMKVIAGRTEADHLEKALFRPWRYDDPVEKQTLRWDPVDDVRRAHRWRDPSGDPQRKRRGGMLGANRLAIEGLPLLPSIPVRRRLRTTGFTGTGRDDTFWTWPIWAAGLPLDVVGSLLAHPELKEPHLTPTLQALGVVERYRSRRLTVDKFRSFTPGQPV